MATNLRLQSAALVALLLLSYIGAPASAQEVQEDPKQPSVDNPHMHIYGTDDFSSCFSHFDGEDSTGSAEEGKGMRTWGQGQQVDVDFMCSMNERFRDDMYLDENGTIGIKMTFNVYSADCNDNADCTNLTLTLKKGTFTVATKEFPELNNDGNDQTINWNIDVDRNMTRFNRSGEEPQLRVEFSKPGAQDTFTNCVFFLCGGSFRMYYHTPGNESAEVDFPVMNQSMPSTDDGDEGVLGGAVGDALPGFGLMAGMAALAMAAVANSRLNKKD